MDGKYQELLRKVMIGHGLDPESDGRTAFSLSNEGLAKSGLSLLEIRAFGLFEGSANARIVAGYAIDKLKKEICHE